MFLPQIENKVNEFLQSLNMTYTYGDLAEAAESNSASKKILILNQATSYLKAANQRYQTSADSLADAGANVDVKMGQRSWMNERMTGWRVGVNVWMVLQGNTNEKRLKRWRHYD